MHEDILSCLQHLISLARQKQAVLLAGHHADLPMLVSLENKGLQRLQELKDERAELAAATGVDDPVGMRNPRAVAKMAAAVAELQQINRLNSGLIKEHLDSVEMCLAMLDKALTMDYALNGGANGHSKAMRSIIDMQA